MATRVSSGGDGHDAAGLERVFQARHGDICASRKRADGRASKCDRRRAGLVIQLQVGR